MAETKLSRRQMLKMLGLATFGMALAACAPTPVPPTPTSKPAESKPTAVPPTPVPANVEIEFLIHTWPGWDDVVKECSDKFHAKFPNITVKYNPTDYGQLVTVLTPRFAAKEPPDVLLGDAWQPWTTNFQMLDLTPYIDRDGVDLTLISDIRCSQVVGDPKKGQYGLPFCLVGVIYVYNKTMFDKYGVPYPKEGWTMDDFKKAVITLTRDNTGKPPTDGSFDPTNIAVKGMYFVGSNFFDGPIQAFGGRWWSDDASTCMIDDPHTVECFQLFNDLACKYHGNLSGSSIPTGADPTVSQLCAINLMGDWGLSLWAQIEDFDWDVAGAPAGPITTGTYGASNTLGVAKDSKHRDEAWEFVKYMTTTKEAQVIEAKSVGPSNNEVALSDEALNLKIGKRGPSLEGLRWAFTCLHKSPYSEMLRMTKKNTEWWPVFNDFNAGLIDLCNIDDVAQAAKDTAKQITDIFAKPE